MLLLVLLLAACSYGQVITRLNGNALALLEVQKKFFLSEKGEVKRSPFAESALQFQLQLCSNGQVYVPVSKRQREPDGDGQNDDGKHHIYPECRSQSGGIF
jgi:hypothetical protein